MYVSALNWQTQWIQVLHNLPAPLLQQARSANLVHLQLLNNLLLSGQTQAFLNEHRFIFSKEALLTPG